jgi:hypothetical protein
MRFPRQKGQSLVEAMIALGVLTAGFLGIVTLLSQSLRISRMTSDETRATYLAAEGLELSKSILDHVMWGNAAGIPNIDPWPCFPGGSGDYEFDYSIFETPLSSCGSLNSDKYTNGTYLQFDPVLNLYGYKMPPKDNPVTTSFKRRIHVASALGGNEIIVDSIVTWGGNQITLEDHFYNWVP